MAKQKSLATAEAEIDESKDVSIEEQHGGEDYPSPGWVTVKKEVRIIAFNKRYRNHPYHFAVPQNQTNGQYVTGQEHILSYENMVVNQATNSRKPLTEEQVRALEMGPEPYIIDPFSHYPLIHGRTFNLSYRYHGIDEPGKRIYLNPKDHAEFTFFTRMREVAKNKKSYMSNRHHFYIEDKVNEAIEEVNAMDLEYEAADYIRSLPVSRYPDIIMLMNFSIAGFNRMPENMREVEMKTAIYKACREHSKVIIGFKSIDNRQTLMALKLLRYGLIRRRDGLDFYADDRFIGANLEAVKSFLSDPNNNPLVSRWAKIIEQKEK